MNLHIEKGQIKKSLVYDADTAKTLPLQKESKYCLGS